jgi:hypothetical protein
MSKLDRYLALAFGKPFAAALSSQCFSVRRALLDIVDVIGYSFQESVRPGFLVK